MSTSRIPLNIVIFLSILIALPSYRFLALEMEIAFQGMNYHIEQRLLAFMLHISAAPVALLIGGFQFIPGLRMRFPAIHRIMGRIYVLAVLIGGISGLVLAFGNENGDLTRLGFGLLSTGWLICTALATHHAIARRIGEHRKWMTRSFALTFAGVTLRIYLSIFLATGFEYSEAVIYLAWICWVPNLLFAQWWLRRYSSQS